LEAPRGANANLFALNLQLLAMKYTFLLTTSKLGNMHCAAKNIVFAFNLISPRGEEVASHIFCQLQLLLLWHVMFCLHCFGFVHWKFYFHLRLGVLEFSLTTPSSYIWNCRFSFLHTNVQRKQSSSFPTNFNIYSKKWHLESCFVDLNTHLYRDRNEKIY
jgi:hypothetical protein